MSTYFAWFLTRGRAEMWVSALSCMDCHIVTIWGLKASLSCLKLILLLSFIFSVALTIYMGYIVQNLSLIRLQNLTGCIVDAQHNSSSLYEIISQFHNPLRTPTHESLRWASLFCTKEPFQEEFDLNLKRSAVWLHQAQAIATQVSIQQQ